MAAKQKQTSRKKTTSKKAVSRSYNETYINLSIGVACIAIALYMVFLISKGTNIHSSQISTELGIVGAYIYKGIRILFGQCEYFAPALLALVGCKYCVPKLNLNNRILLVAVVIVMCLLAFRHVSIEPSIAISKGMEGIGGGIIGAAISFILVHSISKIGAIITLSAIMIISIYIGSNGRVMLLLQSLFASLQPAAVSVKDGMKESVRDSVAVVKQKKEENKARAALKVHDDTAVNQRSSIKKLEANKAPKPEKALSVHNEESLQPNKMEEDSFIENVKVIHEEIIVDDEINKVESYMSSGEAQRADKSIALKRENYVLPEAELLDQADKKVQTDMREIEDNAALLKETLEDFGVKGEINNVNVGPTITQYEFKPAAGVRVTKIVNLADDLALSLAASDIRIEAPIPNKSAVGIEVPNAKPRTVKFREVIDSDIFKDAPSKLTFALGKDISGYPMVGDLAKMPHLLIAGATGAGKSVCLNALITSILFKAKPNEVKFIMVDPKKVELSHYSNLPHLLAPVVTEPKKAAATLKWVVKEMERRYDVFAETGSRDLTTYNAKYIKAEATGEEDHPLEFMPQIVVIIDELADLMMVAPADVEDSVCRLAQLARAAGIHLVIATQRPSVDIITGLIKANIPSRIAFAVASQTDSRTILDMGGAEKLLGNGDMLYFPRGNAKPVRIQGVYVTDDEIERIISYVKRQAAPVFDGSITQEVDTMMMGDIFMDLDNEAPEQDKLLGDACRFFIENGNASISMLQRHFRIGYTRAARIIDELESLGFVGPYEGSKARKINISLSECEDYFGGYGREE